MGWDGTRFCVAATHKLYSLTLQVHLECIPISIPVNNHNNKFQYRSIDVHPRLSIHYRKSYHKPNLNLPKPDISRLYFICLRSTVKSTSDQQHQRHSCCHRISLVMDKRFLYETWDYFFFLGATHALYLMKKEIKTISPTSYAYIHLECIL